MTLIDLARHLRFRPYPSDSESGRAAERLRRAAWTMVAHIASSASGLIIVLLSVNWTLPYLGPERFGAWMTIASLVTALSFLDLGVGNGLTNRIAQAASMDDARELSRAVCGGLGVLLMIAAALLLLLLAVSSLLPWQTLIKTSSAELVDEVRCAALVFAALLALTTCTDGVLRIYHGLQRGAAVYTTTLLCNLVGLLLLYVAARKHASISYLLLCTMGAAALPGLLLWFELWRQGLFRFTAWSQAISIERPNVLRVGMLFFALQIGSAFSWGFDNLIISSTLGASAVAAFSVVQRMYLISTQPLVILNGPLWPAYADAHARDDRAFIRRTLATAVTVTAVYGAISVVALASISEPLLRYWTHNQVPPSRGVVYALGVWTLVVAIANCFAMFMNGVGAVLPQVVAVLVIVLAGIPLKYVIIQSFGLAAMVLAFAGLFALTLVILYGYLFRAHVSRALGLTPSKPDRQ